MVVTKTVWVRAGILFCLICGFLHSEHAIGQRLGAPILNPAGPFADQDALVCEAGALIGSNSRSDTSGTNHSLDRPSDRNLVLLDLVTRVDVNRNLHLEHRELKALDHLSRQRLLKEMDTNRDRQLSAEEIKRVLAPEPSLAPSDYPYPEGPDLPSSPQPETFRNMRRYGIGVQPVVQTPRREPFARAATFGTTPGFPAPRQKSSIGPAAGGLRGPSGQFRVTARCR